MTWILSTHIYWLLSTHIYGSWMRPEIFFPSTLTIIRGNVILLCFFQAYGKLWQLQCTQSNGWNERAVCSFWRNSWTVLDTIALKHRFTWVCVSKFLIKVCVILVLLDAELLLLCCMPSFLHSTAGFIHEYSGLIS